MWQKLMILKQTQVKDVNNEEKVKPNRTKALCVLQWRMVVMFCSPWGSYVITDTSRLHYAGIIPQYSCTRLYNPTLSLLFLPFTPQLFILLSGLWWAVLLWWRTTGKWTKCVRRTDLCELAADSTFGFEARFGRVLLVLVRAEAARAAELLEGLAGVNLGHDGALHVCDVPEKHKHKHRHINICRKMWTRTCKTGYMQESLS